MNERIKRENKIASRKDLISFFKKGKLPTEEHFEKLIRSNFNRADDLLDISEKDGFMVYPTDEGKLLNFYQDKNKEDPAYTLSITPDKEYPKGIYIQEQAKDSKNHKIKEAKNIYPEFFIETGSGNIGIGKNTPKQKLDINGIIASQGRVGNFKDDDFPTDGKWHNVFDEDLTNVNAFEVMAYAKGRKGDGKYSLLHAIATCTFAKSKISKTYSYVTSSNNKINIRWVSRKSKIIKGRKGQINEDKSVFIKIYDWFRDYYNDKIEKGKTKKNPKYNLQLRTMSYYGDNKNDDDDFKLFYKISVLWSPDFKSRESEIKERQEHQIIANQKQRDLKKPEKDILKERNKDDHETQIKILKESVTYLTLFIKNEKDLQKLREGVKTIGDETISYANEKINKIKGDLKKLNEKIEKKENKN